MTQSTAQINLTETEMEKKNYSSEVFYLFTFFFLYRSSRNRFRNTRAHLICNKCKGKHPTTCFSLQGKTGGCEATETTIRFTTIIRHITPFKPCQCWLLPLQQTKFECCIQKGKNTSVPDAVLLSYILLKNFLFPLCY